MARNIETPVAQSVLDRLLSLEEWPTTRAQSIRYMREALRRDMEWLLNSRRSPSRELERFAEARGTVLGYGLPDTSAMSLSSSLDRKRLQKNVEECIARFEPRLQHVRVQLTESSIKDRQLRFHIEGEIRLHPLPEEVTFDTVLDLTSGEYQVV